MHNTAFVLFLAIVGVTLAITYFAARRTRTTSEFYTASGGLTPWQNALAITGDYVSAASFLGIPGLIALFGFDGFFYCIGFLVAYLVVLYLVAEPLRNLGRYTVADMIAARFDDRRVRAAAAGNTVVISVFYMIAQMVGAGALIKLLLGLEYKTAVLIVGALMTVYVVFGGMRATSWVQITKAVLLIFGTVLISLLVLARFGWSLSGMFDQMATATPLGAKFLHSGNKFKDPLDTLSLNMGLFFGTAGLPHILTRFYTVKDAPAARRSVVMATVLIGLFYAMTIFLGFGAARFVGHDAIEAANKAGNMAAPLLAKALGGDFLFAFVSAVAFATIIAVVAGLVLTSASAFAHDIYSQILRRGQATEQEQVVAARWASVGVAVVSILIALGAEGQNVAFLVGLAFTVAASANTPVILLTIFWRRFTATGALVGMVTGMLSCLLLVAFSPSVVSPEAGKALFTGHPLFPLANPGIVSIPLGLFGCWLGSRLTSRDVDSGKFDEILVRANTGLTHTAAAEALAH